MTRSAPYSARSLPSQLANRLSLANECRRRSQGSLVRRLNFITGLRGGGHGAAGVFPLLFLN